MRAVVTRQINADDPLSTLEFCDDWRAPERRTGWSEITIAATSVNQHDLFSMRGVGSRPDQFPMVLGCDVTGWDEHGNAVVISGVFADPDAGDGDETMDPQRSLVSETIDGSFAERTLVPNRNIVPKPKSLSFREAACLPVAYVTAYRMLFSRIRPLPGQSVLVQGAGGGVATAAIVLARAAGLHVTVTSRSAEKRTKALGVGAHAAIVSGERVAEQVDYVIDTVGQATWAHSMRCLRPGGTIVTAGATTGGDTSADLTRLFFKQISVIGATGATVGETRRLLRFLDASGVRPVIDSAYPLEDLRSAFERLQHPDLFGKVVVDIADPSVTTAIG